jgi:proline iminopeptidase
MRELYPEIEPYHTHRLAVDALHTLHVEECGNPLGLPVIFLHGGPGAGLSTYHRRFFDPSRYRIVLFDQRGCGQSTPFAELTDNTTAHLVEDIERIRTFLGVEHWVVFGGSWGSTLALAYAEFHPDRVRGLALRGIFLCRKSEIDWFLYGLKELAPEAWRAFSGFIPEAERSDLLTAYHSRLMNPDPAIHMAAARAWSVYEGSCSTLLPSPETVRAFSADVLALGLSRMEAHYFMNDIFLPENYLLANVSKIRKIPAVIVQGRYDLVCPIRTADELHQAWPEAAYQVIPDAGHSAMEPGIRAALVSAMDRFKDVA